MIKKLTILLVSLTCLTACVTQPIASGDSAFQQKTASYPKIGQETQVKTGGLIHLYANYEGKFVYRLNQPLSMSFMLGKVVVSNSEVFSESTIDGKTFFCTANNVYIDPMIGPFKPACFSSSAAGTFDNIRIAPGIIAMSKEVNPPVSFSKEEVAWQKLDSPLKRELIFDGMQDGILLFTQKVYEKSLVTPTRLKPYMTKVKSLPTSVIIDGAEFTIVKHSNELLFFKLDKAWQ
jgi:hypothetical protein